MQKQLTVEQTAQNKNQRLTFSIVLMMLYIFFLYNAQQTLFPPVIHSIVMYAFLGWTALSIVSKNTLSLSKYTLWYLGMIGISFVSFIWASDVAFDSIYTMIVTLLITLCFVHTINSYEKLELCFRTFVISADVMGILLVVTGQLDFSGVMGERLGQSITGNANIFSALLMIAVAFASWLFVYKEKKFSKIVYLASFVFLLLLMAISGGRKTVIAVVLCLVWFILTKDSKTFFKKFKNLIKVILVVLALYFSIMKVPFLYEVIGERFEGLFSMLSGGSSSVSSDKLRQQLIKIGIEGWMQKPVLGHGLDTYKFYNQRITGHFYYAHNNYVELLYDLGIIGLVLYYSFIVSLAHKLFKGWKNNPPINSMGIGLILLLVIYDFGGISYYASLMQIVLCLVGLIAYSNINNSPVREGHKK